MLVSTSAFLLTADYLLWGPKGVLSSPKIISGSGTLVIPLWNPKQWGEQCRGLADREVKVFIQVEVFKISASVSTPGFPNLLSPHQDTPPEESSTRLVKGYSRVSHVFITFAFIVPGITGMSHNTISFFSLLLVSFSAFVFYRFYNKKTLFCCLFLFCTLFSIFYFFMVKSHLEFRRADFPL